MKSFIYTIWEIISKFKLIRSGKIVLLITTLPIYHSGNSQNLILNGSFENNSATSNTLNLTSAIGSTLSNCFEVDGGSLDLITSNTCGTASNGSWYVTCSPVSATWPYLAFSFKLKSTLTLGAQYTLTFDKRFCGPNSSPIDIGISNDSTKMGTAIHTFATPTLNSWVAESYVFQAPLAAKYLTVNVGITGGTGTVGLDNFNLQAGVMGINSYAKDYLKIFPNPADDIITLVYESDKAEHEYLIYDFTGKIITSGKLKEKTTTINISGFGSGLYFIKIVGINANPIKFFRK